MGTMTGAMLPREILKERLGPALEALDRNVRGARRAVHNGRYAMEDLVAETTHHVRRHPLRTLALAAGAGVLGGCLIGLAIARSVTRR